MQRKEAKPSKHTRGSYQKSAERPATPGQKKLQVRVKWDPDKVGLETYTVAKLPLGERAKNALCRAKIFTLGDLMEHWDDLQDIKNLGAKTAKEIHATVFALLCEKAHVTLGIDLRQEREVAQ